MSFTKAEMKVMFAWGVARGSKTDDLRNVDGTIDAKKLEEVVENSFESLLQTLKGRKLEKQRRRDIDKEIEDSLAGKNKNVPITGLIKER